MYTDKIKPKIEKMFDDIKIKVQRLVIGENSTDVVVEKVSRCVNSEITSRSKTILTDMLFDLSNAVLQTPDFSDIALQNKFMELNLRQEIMNKYSLKLNTSINYKEKHRMMEATKTGGIVLAIGSACGLAGTFVTGLPYSALIPTPLGILVVVAFCAAVIDYMFVEPHKNKKNLSQAIDRYLITVKEQFLNWFDEIENHFNKRVNEFKKCEGIE